MTGAVLLILTGSSSATRSCGSAACSPCTSSSACCCSARSSLKAGSVLYRFVRYYTGSAPYRRKGPPALLLRVIGPVIMLLTACVFGSGIMLAVTGPSYGPPSGWLEMHRISFIAWAFFIVIHVLAYVPRLPRLLAAEARVAAPRDTDGEPPAARPPGDGVLGGRGTRLALLIASLLVGLVIALLTVHLAGKWESFGNY